MEQEEQHKMEDTIELEDEKGEGIPTFRDDFGSSSAERSMSLTKRKNDLFNFAKMKMQKKKKESSSSNSSNNGNVKAFTRTYT